MRRFDRLNGWQRLWLVLGAGYLIVIAAATILALPTELTVSEYLQDATVVTGNLDPHAPRSFVRVNEKWVEVQALAHYPKTGERIYLLDGKWSEPSLSLQYAKLPHPLSDEELRLLRIKQAKAVGLGVLLWLGPWIFLYVFGTAITWVRDGFRRAPRHPGA